MKTTHKLMAITLASLFSVSAFAVQKDITVIADIDPTVELLQADGSALPQSLRMRYMPGTGLLNEKLSTKIYTNDLTKDVNVQLLAEPVLASVTNPSAAAIPLSVSFNGTKLSTVATTLKATDLYPTGIANGQPVGLINGGSIPMELTVGQKTPGVVATAGSYQGVVSLVMSIAPSAP